MTQFKHPLDALRHHVSGAIERGEASAIVEQRAVQWIVGDNVPGYMPDAEPFGAEDWEHAQQCLRSTIIQDAEAGDIELQAAFDEALEALDALPNGHEFGWTVNNRHYWITKE